MLFYFDITELLHLALEKIHDKYNASGDALQPGNTPEIAPTLSLQRHE